MRGGAGVDNLTGAGGADDMDGGQDGDVYNIDGFDFIFDSGTTGRDKIISGGSYTLADGSGIEDLSTRATIATNLVGNALGNRITGNDAANILRGMAGDDVLVGNAGADRLEGGIGRDNLTGGADADTFFFRNGDSGVTPTTGDVVNDFVTGVDKMDLQAVPSGGIAVDKYAEVAVATSGFTAIFNAAQAEMADGQQRVVFVAGATDGWLFWNTDADFTTIEETAKLIGLNTLASFAHADLL